MYTLYERRTPVFIDAPANSGGCVVDLRLHWTGDAQITENDLDSTITSSLEPGGSVVAEFEYTSGARCSIGFVGRHPINSGIFYSAGIECSATAAGYENYIVDNKVYIAGAQIYWVRTSTTQEQDIHSTVAWGGGYILLDLNADPNPHISGAMIEPFNIIFDPVIGDGINLDTTFNNSISIAHNRFTNTPQIAGATVTAPCSFVLKDNALSLSVNSSSTSDRKQYIKTINGVSPIDGNFTIQILE